MLISHHPQRDSQEGTMANWRVQMSKIRINILLLEAGLLTVTVLAIVLARDYEAAWSLAGVCVGGMVAFGNQILEKDD